MRRVRIGITVGDPAGIGPEIAAAAMRDRRVLEVCEPVLFAPASVDGITLGQDSAAGGQAAYDTLVRAVEAAQRGEVDAIATAPVSKRAFAMAGLPWKGHTDLLAHLCHVTDVRMLFYAEPRAGAEPKSRDSASLRAPLCVTLATVHVALKDVPALLTIDGMKTTIAMTAAWLNDLGVDAPRVAVAALNPHASEDGLMGDEDDRILRPAVAAARAQGIDASGPWPADTIFVRTIRGEFDAVVACYHDQGLIPVKLLAFGDAVNVTIGLPIIRTSVDHGTAFDIAGKGVADPGSLIAAVRLAAHLAERRQTTPARAVHSSELRG
ncbi:MAG: 4-hydroxythreonine-4-phosphate dehydrogenase PdxA [Acidobacteria bacterium]|nr:4-hydroxythreonine-4-phosphate dehydrogenase PdxA [Acidobacteriota bacterium]